MSDSDTQNQAQANRQADPDSRPVTEQPCRSAPGYRRFCAYYHERTGRCTVGTAEPGPPSGPSPSR